MNKAVAALLALSFCCASILGSGADAKQKLDSLKSPLTVQMASAIDGTSAQPGDRFTAVLTEAYEYRKMELPAGTRFEGEVVKVNDSRHVARPGYVVLQVTRATMPDGYTIGFTPAEFPDHDDPIYHKDANNIRRLARDSWPFIAVNTAIQVPLKVACGFSGAETLPLAVAGKMALGVGREYIRDDKPKDRPDSHKVGYGMLVGTGLPGLLFMLAKRPEPNLQPGDNVALYLEPKGLRELFAHGSAER
jgi:hypothetical protein